MFNVGGVKVATRLPNRWVATHGKPGQRTLYLTFDDGPNPEYTLPVCDLLAQHGAKATFFCIGDHLAAHPEIARDTVARGHLLANHSLHHQGFRRLPLSDQIAEAEACQALIRAIDPLAPPVFRAPQGQLSLPLLFSLKRRGWHIVHWSLDAKDYLERPLADHLAIFTQRPAKDGDVLLFHDDGQTALNILREMLPRWKAEGFHFATVAPLVG